MARILLVDDEPNVLAALSRLLKAQLPQTQVESHSDPFAALARCSEVVFDLVVSDYRMPSMDGVSFLRHFAQRQPDATRIVLSATVDFDILAAAINEAAISRYLAKPWDEAAFLLAVRDGLEQASARREMRVLADAQLAQQGELSAQEHERRHWERIEPGLTSVRRDSDGAIIVDPNEPNE